LSSTFTLLPMNGLFLAMLSVVSDFRNEDYHDCPTYRILVTWSFPIWLNLFQAKELDTYRDAQVGVEDVEEEEKKIGDED
jgi:hypothetical protein